MVRFYHWGCYNFHGRVEFPVITPNVFYSASLAAAGLICMVVVFVVSQMRRTSAGAVPLMALMLALSWWDITYSFFWAGAPGPYAYFWLDLTFVGVVAVPPAVLVFTLRLTRYGHWVKPPLVIALCIEPALVLAALFTDPKYGLFFAGKRVPGMGMIPDGGPLYWANVIYSYGVVLFSTILIVQSFLRAAGLYRKQLGWLLAGIGISWVNSFIFVLGFRPLPNADNTPFSFFLLGIVFTFALLHYHLLDVVPIARDTLIESMSDGVVVLDAQKRVVDINHTVQKELNVPTTDSVIGKPVEAVFPNWTEFIKKFSDVNEAQLEVPVGNPPRRYLDFRISPLTDNRRQLMGRLIVWRDITELKQAQIELYELATRDSLTQAMNRRRFLELTDRALARAARFGHPLSLALLDIDNFKTINDVHGHIVGDQVLQAFVRVCQKSTRNSDLFARWGGDEFIILLTETDLEQASQFVSRMSNAIAETLIEIGSLSISLTISMGLSALFSPSDTLEALVSRADQALYAAKRAGRNQTMIWEAPDDEMRPFIGG